MKQIIFAAIIMCSTYSISYAQQESLKKNSIGFRFENDDTHLFYTRNLKNTIKLRLSLSTEDRDNFSLGIQKDLVTNKELSLYHGIDVGYKQIWDFSSLQNPTNGYFPRADYFLGFNYSPSNKFNFFLETNALNFEKRMNYNVKTQTIESPKYKLLLFDKLKIGATYNF